MSDLQLALIAAGAAAVAGVWGYNKWQERQQRKLAEKIFHGGQPDVLLGGDEAAAGVARSDVAEPRLEPVGHFEPTAVAAEPEREIDLPPLPVEYADEVADCVIRIDFVEPVPAPALWTAQSRWAGQITKPMSWLGFDEGTGTWRRLSAQDVERYATVCGALQLADRRGAASDAELSIFFDGVREVAGQCSGVADLPRRDDVLMQARSLDEFCASVDLQLGVNVVTAGEPFAGSGLRGIAEAAGLKLQADGCFHALDGAGMTAFTMANIGTELFYADSMKSLATHGVTLSLDVPRVSDGLEAFDALLSVAQKLTDGMDGVLVDSQGSPLSAEMIAGIRTKVEQLQRDMTRHHILAGSVRALRLFS
jgi:hypothetical protein